MKILIVDDSKAMRMIVRRTLREIGLGGAAVSEASNADEALQAMTAAQPDLTLCDWNMPGMTGLDLLKSLRAAGSPAKLGFVTSECTDEMRQMAAEAGALFLIGKPFTSEDFEVALAGVFPS